MKIEKNVKIFKLDFHIISGMKKLLEVDLNLPDGVNLPPSDVATPGSKHFVDKAVLRPFNNLYAEAKKVCTRYGVQFLGGSNYAVAVEKASEVDVQLQAICQDFNAKVIAFADEVERKNEEHALANPAWAAAIRSAAPTRERIRSFMSASYICFDIGPAQGLEGSFSQVGASLSSELFRDVAEVARAMIKSLSQAGPDKGVNQKFKSYLSTITDKLRALAFLDSASLGIANFIDHKMAQLPSSGYMKGAEFNELVILAGALNDPTGDQIKAMSSALVSTVSPLDMPTETQVAQGAEVAAVAAVAEVTESTEGSNNDLGDLPLMEVVEEVVTRLESVNTDLTPQIDELPVASPSERDEVIRSSEITDLTDLSGQASLSDNWF